MLNSCYNGLVFLFVNLGNLVPKRHESELVGVGNCAFYAAMGTFVEGCQNRKNNDCSENMKNKMFYYLKKHDGDGIALICGLVRTVQNVILLIGCKPEPHSFFFLSDLLTNFEVLAWRSTH